MLVVAALACLATGTVYQYYEATALLVNRSHREHEVQVFRAQGPLDCDVVLSDPELLQSATFELAFCDTVAAVPLSVDWRHSTSTDDGEGPGGEAPDCDAVVVRAQGLGATLVFWGDSPRHEVEYSIPPRGDELKPNMVVLEQARAELFLTPTRDSALSTAPFEGSLPEAFSEPFVGCSPGEGVLEQWRATEPTP